MTYDANRFMKFAAEQAESMKDRPTRDSGRIPEVLQALALYWQEQPDLRLGQILGNFNIGYMTEDEILLERLRDPKAYHSSL